MQHANSPLTPKGRHRMVLLVEEEDLTFEAAAAASNVAKSTRWEWVRRWRAAAEDERRGLACLGHLPGSLRRRVLEGAFER
ncbi:MAG TPA: leucine zipper domain-containing protein [Solirubrobacterales bacterium]|jgi:transposase-like protein|nr:leucine zipper domain-containing protein [Solirubrobacterales bacterium]